MDTTDNLRPLRATDISPEMVLKSLEKEMEHAQQMYVVLFYDNEAPAVFVAGGPDGLPHASLILTDMAQAYVRGEISPAPLMEGPKPRGA